MSLVNTDNNFRTAEFSSELRMKVKLNLYWYHGRKDSALTVLLQATLRTPKDVAPTSLSSRGSSSDVCHSVTRTRRLRSATPSSLRVQHTCQHLLQWRQSNISQHNTSNVEKNKF